MQTIADVSESVERQRTEIGIRHFPREELVLYISQLTFDMMCLDSEFFKHVTMHGPDGEFFHGIPFMIVTNSRQHIVQLCRRQK